MAHPQNSELIWRRNSQDHLPGPFENAGFSSNYSVAKPHKLRRLIFIPHHEPYGAAFEKFWTNPLLSLATFGKKNLVPSPEFTLLWNPWYSSWDSTNLQSLSRTSAINQHEFLSSFGDHSSHTLRYGDCDHHTAHSYIRIKVWWSVTGVCREFQGFFKNYLLIKPNNFGKIIRISNFSKISAAIKKLGVQHYNCHLQYFAGNSCPEVSPHYVASCGRSLPTECIWFNTFSSASLQILSWYGDQHFKN